MFGTLFGGGPFGQYGVYPTTQPAPPTRIYLLEVDWNNDGLFSHTSADITSYVIDLDAFRGRNEPNTLRGRCEPGTFKVVLDNRSGIFSPYLATSPVFGLLLPRRRIRWSASAPTSATRWQGKIQDIIQDRIGALPVVIIEARGPLMDVADARVSPPADSGSLTGTIVGKVLDAAGYSASLRTIDAGQTTTSAWYVNDRPGLEALREMEECELGLVSESPACHIVFRDRAYRSSGARLTSQVTYSSAPGATYPYRSLQVGDPLKNLVNNVRSSVTPYSTAGAAILWTLTGETPTIGPGASKTWYATVSGTTLYVAAWSNLVSGTDYTVSGVALGDLTVTLTKYATTMKIVIQNTHVSNVATITLLQAKGTAVSGGTPTVVEGTDATSAGKYGTRSYQLASPWLPNTNTAQSYVDSIIAAHKDPLAPVSLSFTAGITDALLTDLLTRDIHDRVTVIADEDRDAIALNGQFFIESIRDHWNPQKARHDVVLGLSQTVPGSSAWILGTSVLGTSTYVGF